MTTPPARARDPYVADPEDVDRWARDLRVAADRHAFFGSCTYYSYILATKKN